MADNDISENPISNSEEQHVQVESESNLNEETPHASQNVKRLRGWCAIVLLFLVMAGVGFLPAIGLAIEDMLTTWDFGDIGREVLDYVQNNNRQFPLAEKWCDTILEKKDAYLYLSMRENNKEYFPYTLNKHIIELSEIPADNIVVLFTGVSGWNQVGDVELIQHCSRTKVFFGNGDIRSFRKSHFQYLRWNPDDSGIIPEPDVKIPLIAISVFLGIVFLGILVSFRESLKIFWVLALGIGILSSSAGALLGSIAEGAYYKLAAEGSLMAPWIGGICCFVIGASFITIIGNVYKKYNANVSMLGYGTVIGAITGMIASSIIHGYLMIEYEEKSFAYMLAGSCFGILAGILLGWISSGLIRFYKNKPVILQTNMEVLIDGKI